jgi:o-succinylbenzoate synthase
MAEIKEVEVYIAEITYEEPFRISLGTTEGNEEVIIRLVDSEGFEGWGEGSPSLQILGETAGTMLSVSDVIGPRLIGMDPEMLQTNLNEVSMAIKGNSAIKAAYDIALHDLYGRRVGISLYKLLGGFREKVECDYTIGIVKKEAAVEKAVRLLERGFHRIKLKVGDEEDVERVREVRKAVGKDIKIFIDANQAWSPYKAIKAIKDMEAYEVELVEQPVKARDIEGLSFVRRKVDTPIMVDESVYDAVDAIKVVKAEAADYINIKLMKCGGIREGMKIAHISEASGIRNIVGCMLEGGISIAAAVHFSCSSSNVAFTDLDSDLGLLDNFVIEGGAGLDEGCRIVPRGVGLGDLRLDYKRLRKVRSYVRNR